jgi:hypothetical protein
LLSRRIRLFLSPTLYTRNSYNSSIRWLILSLIAYLLAHWVDLWAWPPVLDWKATARLTLEKLLPSVLWSQLRRQLRRNADIAAQFGFEIIIKSLPDTAYRDWCKI